MKKNTSNTIILGLAIAGAFLLFHRIISNKMLDDNEKKE